MVNVFGVDAAPILCGAKDSTTGVKVECDYKMFGVTQSLQVWFLIVAALSYVLGGMGEKRGYNLKA